MEKVNSAIWIVLLVTVCCALTVVHQTGKLIRTINEIVVYDIDAVRLTFLEEANYMYTIGCYAGTEKPVSLPTPGFDKNSVAFYCSDRKDKLQEYLIEEAKKLGRR